MMPFEPARGVRVTVVTYRRPQLLRRALESVQRQTYPHWYAEVVNDDPDDRTPGEIVDALGDDRISIFKPAARRGATSSIGLGWRPGPVAYAAVLEDDNWWEPAFLATMIEALDAHPSAALLTANERFWIEEPGNRWRGTDETIRPDRDWATALGWTPLSKCGDAILCNSAMVARLERLPAWQLPNTIAVDVSEHYFERIVPHPIVVHDRALVNFARTLQTARSSRPFDWTKHQVLLIGSVIAGLRESLRDAMAQRLWARTRSSRPEQRVSLLLAARYVPEAGELGRHAATSDHARLAAHLIRHPRDARDYSRLMVDLAIEWTFLRQGWTADALARITDPAELG